MYFCLVFITEIPLIVDLSLKCAHIEGSNALGTYQVNSWTKCQYLCFRNTSCKSFEHRLLSSGDGGNNCALSRTTWESKPDKQIVQACDDCHATSWSFTQIRRDQDNLRVIQFLFLL